MVVDQKVDIRPRFIESLCPMLFATVFSSFAESSWKFIEIFISSCSLETAVETDVFASDTRIARHGLQMPNPEFVAWPGPLTGEGHRLKTE